MSTAAIMMVRDEIDIIGFTVDHLLTQVDQVFVSDNMSTDGTREVLAEMPVTLIDDPVVGYFQARKTTELAMRALGAGHEWVVPCDADEIWYSPFGRIGDVLGEQPEELLFAKAVMFNHIPTGLDEQDEMNPVRRIGWRFVDQGTMAKVACRLGPELRIDMGNHEATSTGKVRSNWSHTLYGQLVIRHFPWRSERQHLSKISNGAEAYAAAPSLDPTYGEHWKAFGLPGEGDFEERVNGWFRQWGYREDPYAGGDLTYDPAPIYLADDGGEQEEGEQDG